MAASSYIFSKKMVFMGGALTSLIFSIGLVSILVLLQGTPVLKYFFTDNVAEASRAIQLDTFIISGFSPTIDDSIFSSLKDMWSSQTVFYQTIITFLIAINGLIAAVSFFYIRSNSEERAEEITKKHMDGEIFNINLVKKVKAEAGGILKVAQNDYDTSTSKLNDALTTLDQLTKDNITLKQQLRVISERIASLDTADTEGKDIVLNRRVK